MAQHDSASSTPCDLLGVGFGPSNLALPIALREQQARLGWPLHSLFIDPQADNRWHGNTLITQSELQISFLKDLVTLRNPTSPFDFPHKRAALMLLERERLFDRYVLA
jgi:L-ornithine N5-oxygenase